MLNRYKKILVSKFHYPNGTIYIFYVTKHHHKIILNTMGNKAHHRVVLQA